MSPYGVETVPNATAFDRKECEIRILFHFFLSFLQSTASIQEPIAPAIF